MTTRRLMWLAILLPTALWVFVLFLRSVLFAETRSPAGDLFSVIMLAAGAASFSAWVFGIIDQREKEVRRRTDQLAALHAAALALTTELDLGVVLQKVVDLSRELANARYGALGVLDDTGQTIDQFLTSGISPEERARMGDPPHGHGLLGTIIRDGQSIRVPDIARDPRSVGFPANHPPMHSLLGVPIQSKGQTLGNLYLTDKLPAGNEPGYTTFTEQDQDLLEMFATQAAIAIENAQLYRKTQQLAILQERERFGMDLHDGIIQSIYAIGLMLEDAQHRLSEEPAEARTRISRVLQDLNDVIRDIRNYILDLRPQRFQGRDLQRGLEELARELRANTFLNVNVHQNGLDPARLTPEQTVEILHIVQEALGNIRKHARASQVDISARAQENELVLSVEDNGVGLSPDRIDAATGYGLRNMRERASSLIGQVQFEPREGGGTRVLLRIPLQDG